MLKKLLVNLSNCVFIATWCFFCWPTAAPAQKNIWQLIGKKISHNTYQHNDTVQKQIKWFMRNHDELYHLTKNAKPYIYFVTQQVQKHGMPIELALLPMIESEYKPNSRSYADAIGLWQLRAITARDLGLHINSWYDGRKDVVASTNAALSYLQYLYDYFHSWPLALAAYNAGIGTVTRAINYNRAHHRSIDFWSLPLPQQTKEYVPKLFAIATILSHSRKYPLPTHPVNNQAYFQEIKINKPVSLTKIAELSSTDMQTVHQLNPGIKQTPQPSAASHGYNILVPANKAPSVVVKLVQLKKIPRSA